MQVVVLTESACSDILKYVTAIGVFFSKARLESYLNAPVDLRPNPGLI